MKINWFSTYPVIQSLRFLKKNKKVEPSEKSSDTNNNDKQEDNYSGRSNYNEEERQDMCDYWKVFWKI